MKKIILGIMTIMLCTGLGYSQVNNIGNFNRADINFTGPDSLHPYFNSTAGPANIGIRSVWVAQDLDQDGKPEILATDYSNAGRVHVMELNGNSLEIVWSSPRNERGLGYSTPRWVRDGDLDGDGLREIIFPNSENAAIDVRVRVFEWDGSGDNSFIHAIDLEPNAFSGQGVGNFRTNRELASVYDFDGDGSDELIMQNRDNRTYILGITGQIPGFGGWQLEGGDPATTPKIGSGSHWYSFPTDINGDGDIEIINHYWNFFGFWSIDPTGPDTYTYPDTAQANHYIEFLTPAIDAVAYMGVQPADVDNDGNYELAGIQFSGSSTFDYDLYLIDFSTTDSELYSWESSKIGKITDNAWTAAGASTGSFWGIGAADLNGNGREEILLGGSNGFNIISVEYKGTGSLLDSASYDVTVLYGDEYINKFSKVEIRDSAGVVDTVVAAGSESPFVSKMYSGSDINNNGKKEVVLSYQSVFDSIAYVYQTWSGSAFVTDSTVVKRNSDQVTIRVLESSVATGVRDFVYNVVTPDDYKLEQNYPNPFNPSTVIRFFLPVDKKISLTVYDILGNEVKTLIDSEEFSKGGYEVSWDGTNNLGSQVSSGQYIYTLTYGNFSKSMKMTLVK